MGGLPKLATIKNRRDFLALNGSSAKYVAPGFILVAKERASDHPVKDVARIGYTVTKKMGNAVMRNRIKRRLREAARKSALPLMREQFDYVLISRPAALTCDFSALSRDMEIAFSRIHAKKGAAHT